MLMCKKIKVNIVLNWGHISWKLWIKIFSISALHWQSTREVTHYYIHHNQDDIGMVTPRSVPSLPFLNTSSSAVITSTDTDHTAICHWDHKALFFQVCIMFIAVQGNSTEQQEREITARAEVHSLTNRLHEMLSQSEHCSFRLTASSQILNSTLT